MIMQTTLRQTMSTSGQMEDEMHVWASASSMSHEILSRTSSLAPVLQSSHWLLFDLFHKCWVLVRLLVPQWQSL